MIYSYAVLILVKFIPMICVYFYVQGYFSQLTTLSVISFIPFVIAGLLQYVFLKFALVETDYDGFTQYGWNKINIKKWKDVKTLKVFYSPQRVVGYIKMKNGRIILFYDQGCRASKNNRVGEINPDMNKYQKIKFTHHI